MFSGALRPTIIKLGTALRLARRHALIPNPIDPQSSHKGPTDGPGIHPLDATAQKQEHLRVLDLLEVLYFYGLRLQRF